LPDVKIKLDDTVRGRFQGAVSDISKDGVINEYIPADLIECVADDLEYVTRYLRRLKKAYDDKTPTRNERQKT